MHSKIHLWQWPNILSLDAALVAVAWQLALAQGLNGTIELAASFVLGLSVWLSYSADRLFDVARRPADQLLSARHSFAKKHQSKLWSIWALVLIANLSLAVSALNTEQMMRGSLLLALCLAYNLCNQILSRRFFPKEACVALIFTGGVLVFQTKILPLDFACFFALLCLGNCLAVGVKEKLIDAEMQIHSLAPMVTERWLGPGFLSLHLFVILAAPVAGIPLSLSFLGLGILYLLRTRLPVEAFRVLADSWLILPPLVYLIN